MKNKEKMLLKKSEKYFDSVIANHFKNANIFVCYDSSKKPRNPFTGKLIDITNLLNLSTYNDALNGCTRNSKLEGIGIVLGKTSGKNLCGLDIDECIDDAGNIHPEAMSIINSFKSYTEISKSGKGIHILFFANKKGNLCKVSNLGWCKCLELYDSNRYFALTENVINTYKVNRRQKVCDLIYTKYFEDKTSIEPDSELTSSTNNFKIEHLEVDFQCALEKDFVLNNYWYGIRTFADESCNDLGFCKKLAFYLKRESLILEYFLKSPYFSSKDTYHQNKWLKRKDYSYNTILKAMRGI